MILMRRYSAGILFSPLAARLLLAALVFLGSSFTDGFTIVRFSRTSSTTPVSTITTTNGLAGSSRDTDEQGDGQQQPGMAEAFRQLDALQSLGGSDDEEEVKPSPSASASNLEATSSVPEVPSATTEQEAQLYTKMMQEMEQTDEEGLYSDLIADLGGSDGELSDKKSKNPDDANTTTTMLNVTSPSLQGETEKFMNQALQEALKDVKVKNPSAADSILDDKEIMKEIEAVFERGSAKLIASLEEIRKEQKAMAEQSASKTADESAMTMKQDSERLAQAEASMVAVLGKVSRETAEVEKAAEDLRKAKEEMDKDFLSRLRSGGLPKQASLVGLVLFAVRSIGDTVAALPGNEESRLAVALVEGGLALACALVFFLL